MSPSYPLPAPPATQPDPALDRPGISEGSIG
jgi:hypothetical protein